MGPNGFSYDSNQLHSLAIKTHETAVKLFDVHDRFKEVTESTRAALGGDEFAHKYWQSSGKRMGAISEALNLLKKAVGAQESKLRAASATYKASDEASTVRE
ncbi:hypothetical protein AB0395_31965 [Streptosporangium sp. NPDC051023]|uniref:hypothetical protein n=1 Tax=Streptosporangium sp. NPDC051023 TaxID=3155410 RepID=UPI00344D1BB3